MGILLWLRENWNKPLPERELSAKSVALMQFFQSGLGITLCIAAMFDGSLTALPRWAQDLAFVVIALTIVIDWVGLIFSYGLLRYQRWAWVGSLILQILSLVGLIGSLPEMLSRGMRSPQPLSLPLLIIQLNLVVIILSGLFKCREEFFDA